MDTVMPALDPDRVFCASSPYAQAMDDETFWAHVYLQEGMGENEQGWGLDTEQDETWEEEIVSRGSCPICGAAGACGRDDNGLPLIHAIPLAFDG